MQIKIYIIDNQKNKSQATSFLIYFHEVFKLKKICLLLISKSLKKANEWSKVISVLEIKNRVEDIFDKENMEPEYFLIAET